MLFQIVDDAGRVIASEELVSREFPNTGSCGYNVSMKVNAPSHRDGKTVKHQLGLNVIEVGSKEWGPKDTRPTGGPSKAKLVSMDSLVGLTPAEIADMLRDYQQANGR